jgi:carbonic anhydrase
MMGAMATIDELLRRHRGSEPSAPPSGAVPSAKAALLMCMDTRINPYAIFGLAPGEVHLLRNAGGVVTEDVLRSLAVSQYELGTEEVLVMQHSRCGMSTVTEEGFKAKVAGEAGLRPTWAVESFADVTASVRDSAERVRRCAYLKHVDAVRGVVYHVDTGRVSEAG